jgi:hypothetical protein
MDIIEVLQELYWTLMDAWEAADLAGRLASWWWVVTHPQLVKE